MNEVGRGQGGRLMLRGQVGGWGVRTVKRDPCTVDPACPDRATHKSLCFIVVVLADPVRGCVCRSELTFLHPLKLDSLIGQPT